MFHLIVVKGRMTINRRWRKFGYFGGGREKFWK